MFKYYFKIKLLFINTLFISIIGYIFSVVDVGVGKYFVLNNFPNETYLFSTKDCTKTYICKSKDEGFFSDDVYDYYYRTKIVNGSFGPTNRVDPGECIVHGLSYGEISLLFYE